jgi:hypothetical protein
LEKVKQPPSHEDTKELTPMRFVFFVSLCLRGFISGIITTKSRRCEGMSNPAFYFLCVFVTSWVSIRNHYHKDIKIQGKEKRTCPMRILRQVQACILRASVGWTAAGGIIRKSSPSRISVRAHVSRPPRPRPCSYGPSHRDGWAGNRACTAGAFPSWRC